MASRRRIVIIRNAYAYDFGGGERMPVNLAAVLIDNGHSATIFSRSPKLLAYARSKKVPTVRGWWWSRQSWSGARVLLTPVYFLWQLLLLVWYLCLLLSLRPNIVHAQSKDDFIAATLAAKVLGKKVIWSDHADLKYVYLNLSVWYKNPIGKVVWFCSRFTSQIILTSQEDKRQIEAAAGRELGAKYRIIYNGISDQPELLGKHHGGKRIVFAATSRLVTAKGIGELIAAFETIGAKVDGELWLFGEGPEEHAFRSLAASNPRVRFMGFPDDTIAKVAEADIFVHPSYLEGFSLSIVEAAMLAKPIIACSVGGNVELLKNGRNALLIPPRDSEALAEAMLLMANDKALRAKLGHAARESYEKKFIFERIVKEEYLPLYERL